MKDIVLYSLGGLVIYFILLMVVVIRMNRNESLEDYYMGGRKLSFWLLSLTFIASWWGAGSALSTADLAFTDGISAYWVYAMPVLFSTILMAVLAKKIRRIPAMTQPEMITLRYGKTAGVLVSVIVYLFMMLSAASQMVGIGLFFSGFLDFSYEWGVLIGTVIVLSYSLFSGFRGVVFTDVIQFFFLTVSTLYVCYIGFYSGGNLNEIKAIVEAKHQTQYFDFLHNIGNNMIYVLTFGAAWMIQANVWQRIMATRTAQDAYKMTIVSLFIYIPLYAIAVFTGMSAIPIYDTLPAGGVIPALTKDFMSPVAGALVFIGVCSAIMSTMDSLINTGSMILSKDIYQDRINPSAKQTLLVKIGLISTTVTTLIGLIIALNLRSILEVSWIAADILATGCFIPIVMSFFWRRGTHKGAVCSIVFGITYSLCNLLIQMGVTIPTFWKPGSAEQIIYGMSLSFLIFILVSLFTKPDLQKANYYIEKSRGE
ncbi:MAG: sodium:solute symporter family protein [Marinifilaceae bacterium]